MKMQKCLKRLLSFTFALLMVLSCVPAQSLTGIELLPKASAAQWSGGFEYEVIAGEAYITGFDEDAYGSQNVVVPQKLGGYKVVSISDEAFCWSDIDSVQLPDGIKNIGYGAFYDSNISKCNIPSSVVNIGDFAFYESKLSGEFDFSNVQSIGEDAFTYTSITGLANLKNVKELGNAAFQDTKITSVILSKNLKKIEDNVFSYSSIESISIPEGEIASIGWKTFKGCTELKEISLPNSIKTIGYYAFEGSGIQSIKLPSKLETISERAFGDCKNLTSVTIPNSVTIISDRAFEGNTSLQEVTIGTGLEELRDYVFSNCSMLKKVTFAGSVESIGEGCFMNCKSLKSIELPKGVVNICGGFDSEFEYGAFQGCVSLEKVLLPNTVKSIDCSAFKNCNNLTSIVIPPSVTEIEDYALGYIDAGINGKMPGFTIYGTKGTAAETYAKENGFAFVEHKHKTVSETTKATTTKDGSIVSTCTECGEDVSIKKIAKVSRISLSKTAYSYDGKVKTPSVTVKDANGKTLKKGTDYTVTYSAGRTKIGKYTVTVTLKGSNYSGSKTLSFTVGPVKPTSVKAASRTANSVTLTWGKVSGASGYVVYRYSDSTKKYTKVATVKTNKATVSKLKAGTTYKFAVQAYKTSGKDTYYGETGALFTTTTNPAAPSIKVTSTAKGKAYISFKKVTGATKYEFYCSTSKSGTYKKLSTSSTAYYTASKLRSGKTYYFKVRAYKTLGKTNYYSSYSAVRSVKVK